MTQQQTALPAYRTLAGNGSAELVEKKSRFLAFACPCTSEEEARAVLEAQGKAYWDASHVCYAYIIGKPGATERFSDAGEPSGTAGRPILDVLRGAGVTDTLIYVVRYFGGTLLGTGGLVRAYGGAAKAALQTAPVIDRVPAAELIIRTDYTDVGRILYLLGQEGIAQSGADYGADVTLTVLPPDTQRERLIKQLTEATAGRVRLEDGPQRYLDREVPALRQEKDSL